MLDPLTILEVHDLVCQANLAGRGITLSDVREFVISHAHADAIYVARAEDGTLHGALFGWPIRSVEGYGGEYVDEPDGSIFYWNLLVTGVRGPNWPSTPEIVSILKLRVQQAHLGVSLFCYHRSKHGDRIKLFELERLDRDGR